MKERLGLSKDEIKVEFVKAHPEVSVELIHKLFDRIDEQEKQIQILTQEVKELKARLSKDSSNSSKPPSSDNLYKPAPTSLRKKSQKASGGQKGHKGSTLQRIEHPDEVVTHYPTGRCQGCGREVLQSNCCPSESHQVIDITVKPFVKEYVTYKYKCRCGYTLKAEMPQDAKAPVQYGNRVKALIIYLRNYQMLPYNRITQFFGDILGIKVSSGTIATYTKSCADKLANWSSIIKEMLLNNDVLHVDETGIKTGKKLTWMHVCSTSLLTMLHVAEKRGVDGTLAGGLKLREYQGILVHDFWKAYYHFECTHANCIAHIQRELVFQRDILKEQWAEEMFIFFEQGFHFVKQAKEDRQTHLSPHVLSTLREQYCTILTEAQKQHPEKINLETKRIKRTKTQNLIRRLVDYQEDLLRFLSDFKTPFTNNQAERDLRMSKVVQKISGCYRTLNHAQYNALIRAYLSTARKNAQSSYHVLYDLFRGRPFIPQLNFAPPPE